MTHLRSLAAIIVALFIVIFAGAAFVFVGGYNVAATNPDSAPMQWILHTTMHRSVSARASSIQAPAQFTQQQVREGYLEFGDMCVTCHGAPGKDRGEIGKGLNPSPPNLAEVESEWSSAEIFWILKNGIKMTGMPAFGPTHSDDRLWTIVAFVRQLPQLSAEDYAKFEDGRAGTSERQGGEQKHDNEHSHEHDHDHKH